MVRLYLGASLKDKGSCLREFSCEEEKEIYVQDATSFQNHSFDHLSYHIFSTCSIYSLQYLHKHFSKNIIFVFTFILEKQ